MKSKLEIHSKLEEKKELLRRAKATNHFENIKTLECQIKIYEWCLE